VKAVQAIADLQGQVHQLQGQAHTTRFSPYCNKSLRQHHYFGCNRGVLLHRNSDLVAICVSIATQNLSCIIYLFGCNMLTLMHPFLGFPLHLVGNNATPILCCISIPYVATESCYSHHTRDGCVWTSMSQRKILVANTEQLYCN
jgi:hypothetical protein